MFNEIHKLDKMLTEAGLPHTLKPFALGFQTTGYQIRLYTTDDYIEEIDDCVCHSFSHGYELDLLETYRLHDCEGYETAEQVFEGWQGMYNKAVGR